jgi:hypothetical protein
MEKTDKRLFALATALIVLAMVWFAQFSRAQQNDMFSVSIVQILDATRMARVEAMTARPAPIPTGGT